MNQPWEPPTVYSKCLVTWMIGSLRAQGPWDGLCAIPQTHQSYPHDEAATAGPRCPPAPAPVRRMDLTLGCRVTFLPGDPTGKILGMEEGHAGH